ncbi:unnamed protein product [Urochloa decumbens]|uniref:Uncharacterized protein n=1 Tax=Urochloa decumbens TaxID=240449 RepID=A0ABC9D1I1_9POAL
MASFASQLKDMLVVLVEHVIMGYGGGTRGEGGLHVVRRMLVVDPPVSEGSVPQVH